jgi:replicative DNA helicase
MGKTSAVMNMAENAAIMHGKHVAVFSLEMSKEQLALRLLCSQAEVDLHKVRTGFVANNDWSNLTSGAARLSKASIYIDDAPGQSLLEIRAKCRRLRAQGKLDLVVIDYLQLMRASGPAENRVQEISQISRGLKAIAKELGVPVIALSQLSRAVEQRGGSGRPQLSDLRESGSIEQDADVVMFVYREVVYKPDTPEPNKAQIIIAKQRNGPTDDVDLTFLRGCTKFVPYSPVMPGETEPGF